MKKTLITLLSVFLLFGLLTGMSITAQAKTTYESEDNNSYSTADKITLGNSIVGTLSSSGDCDYYKVTPTANGKITIKFKHTYEESYDSWLIYLYRYTGGEYVQLSNWEIGSGENESIALPYIGAVKNGTYFIKVFSGYYKPENKKYTISTSFTESNYYEKERNNSYSTATNMTLEKSYSGTMNDSSDQDYYKIVPSSNGKISISFKHEYEEDYSSWLIYLYRYTGGEYVQLSNWEIGLGDNESIALPYIGAVKNGVYYIKVCNGYYKPIGKNYTLKTQFTSSAYYEKEPNNAYKTATNVSLNNTYGGNINSSSDSDFYKIVAPMSGKISITFNHSYADSYDSWVVYVYKYSNGSYTQLSVTEIALASQGKTSLPSINTSKNGVYYIKVCSGYYKPIGNNYSLSVSFSFPGSTSFKVASRSTTNLKFAWSKVSGASGYQLQRKSGSSYKTVATTSSTSYNVSKLTAGTNYTFRVRAYKTVNGKNYYSTWKSLTTATKPGTPTLKVTAGSKKATLSWNKQTGASGYVLYMATSKNGKYSKIATLKGCSKTSYTKTGLTKGKTYYFKVIAYKTSGSSNVYGSYSSVKPVKIK